VAAAGGGVRLYAGAVATGVLSGDRWPRGRCVRVDLIGQLVERGGILGIVADGLCEAADQRDGRGGNIGEGGNRTAKASE
jgi:hypothetical protein